MRADSDVCQKTERPDPYVFNLIWKMGCHHASDGEAKVGIPASKWTLIFVIFTYNPKTSDVTPD